MTTTGPEPRRWFTGGLIEVGLYRWVGSASGKLTLWHVFDVHSAGPGQGARMACGLAAPSPFRGDTKLSRMFNFADEEHVCKACAIIVQLELIEQARTVSEAFVEVAASAEKSASVWRRLREVLDR